MKTLDIDECADFLKIDRSTAFKLAGEGILPGAKIGRAWVFLIDDLTEYLRTQVRAQQRQRAVEAEVQSGLHSSTMHTAPLVSMSPLAGRKKKRQLPNLDAYLPQLPG